MTLTSNKIKGKISQKVFDKEIKDFEKQLRDSGFKFSIPVNSKNKIDRKIKIVGD